MNSDLSGRIKDSVAALPEVYQDIYGHSEYVGKTIRDCRKREDSIKLIVSRLQEQLGRKNLKILEIGCAQGFYSFVLGSMGCEVCGVDYLDKNIELCNLLKEEQGFENCNFRVDSLTDGFAETISEDYDVILILSVMHHISYQNGFEKARGILETLSRKSCILIAEMALKEEPLYWNTALPATWVEWFANIDFFDDVAWNGTHLSGVSRPLVVCSNKMLFFDGRFFRIDSCFRKAYAAKPDNGINRYYISGGLFIKTARISDDANKFPIDEIKKEIAALSRGTGLSFVPALEYGAIDKSQTKAVVIRGLKQGIILSDIIGKKEKIADLNRCFLNLLDELSVLESRGLYHGDLRAWNVLYDSPKQVFTIIDFGALQESKIDDVATLASAGDHEYTVYDAFVSLVYDVITYRTYDGEISKYVRYDLSFSYDLTALPAEYAAFFKAFLLARDELDFKGIKELFLGCVVNRENWVFSAEEGSRINLVLLKRVREEVLGQRRKALREIEACNDEIGSLRLEIACMKEEITNMKKSRERVKDLRDKALIKTDTVVAAQSRGFVGRTKSLFKRAAKKICFWQIKPLVEQQNEFNAAVVCCLEDRPD